MCSRSLPSAMSAALILGFLILGPAWAKAQDVDALLARGMELHQAGDLLGAVQNYQIALEAQPDRTDIRSNLGAAFVGLGRIDEGIEQYRKALESKDVPSIRQNLGLRSISQGALGRLRRSSSASWRLTRKTSRRRSCWRTRCSTWGVTSRSSTC
jgi:Tfp pilus assembly protein PilF